MDELEVLLFLTLIGFIIWMIYITVKLVGISKQFRSFGLTMLSLLEQFNKRLEHMDREFRGLAERAARAGQAGQPEQTAHTGQTSQAGQMERSAQASQFSQASQTGPAKQEEPAHPVEIAKVTEMEAKPAMPEAAAAKSMHRDESSLSVSTEQMQASPAIQDEQSETGAQQDTAPLSPDAPVTHAESIEPAKLAEHEPETPASPAEQSEQVEPETQPKMPEPAEIAKQSDQPEIQTEAQTDVEAEATAETVADSQFDASAETLPETLADTSPETPAEILAETSAETPENIAAMGTGTTQDCATSASIGATDAPGAATGTAASSSSQKAGDDTAKEAQADGLMLHIRKFIREGNFWVAGGVLMLLIGFAFLMTYMAERGFFSIEMRIASAAATGLAMVVLGIFLRNRKPAYALIVQGGGIGVMYLAVFAAAKLTTLFSPATALILMTLLVIPGVALAVLQSAQVLAIFAFLGGFAAPVLLSDGSGNYEALFSYYTLLNLGLLVITRFRLWRWLNLLGAFCTFVVMAYWCETSYELSQFIRLQPFLIGFALIFTLITMISARRRQFQLSQPADALLACGVPVIASYLQFTLAYDLPHGLSFSALGYGAFYLGLAAFIWKCWSGLMLAQEENMPEKALASKAGSIRLLAELYLACGVILANLAIPLEFSQRVTAAAWSLEGVVLFYLAYRALSPRIKLVALTALAVGLVAALLDLFSQRMIGGDYKLVSSCVTGLAFILAGAIQRIDIARHESRDLPEPFNFRSGLPWENILALIGMGVWFLGLGMESDYMSTAPLNFLLLTVSASALLFSLAGKKLDLRVMCLSAFLPLPVSFVCVLGGVVFSSSLYYGFVYYAGFEGTHPALWYLLMHNFMSGYGWLAWLVFAVCQGALLWGYGRGGAGASGLLRAQTGFQIQNKAGSENAASTRNTGKLYTFGLCLFTLELIYVLTCSLRAMVEQTSHYTLAWADLAGIAPSLLYVIVMLWLSSGSATKPPRLSERNTGALLGTVPGLLFIGLGVWFGMGLFDVGNPYPLPFYVPVLNPLELQQAFCVAIFAVWQRALHNALQLRRELPGSDTALAEASFGKGDLAAKTMRTLHFWALSQPRMILVMSLLLFAWLHSILFRSIHFFTGTPMSNVWDHEAFQALLTALWGLWGLLHIIIGNKKRTRLFWVIGAVLMLAVTIKIFMLDLADKGTLFRIVSFFIMGGIFLIIGWLAPLPPSNKKEATQGDKENGDGNGPAKDAQTSTRATGQADWQTTGQATGKEAGRASGQHARAEQTGSPVNGRGPDEDMDTVYCTRQYSPLSPKNED
ncbi:DUF2339 domain-containing protein [Desulfovibrio sp. OttesenSCG-928-C06]|nr:DUF2339 domain-containing protein [Desulfovibrio sp. OttesenSCG-928-C06]